MFKQDGSVIESPAKVAIPILADYTKIPNVLLDALCKTRLSGECRQLFDVIVRNSLGWSRSESELSLNKLSELTGIRHSSVIRSVKKLESMNIISVNRSGRVSVYGINLNVDQWRKKQKKTASHKKETGKNQEVSLKLDTETSLKLDTDDSLNLETPLIYVKDKLKESIKQSEKPLACFSFENEKATATEQDKTQSFQSLFDVPLPSGSDPAAVAVMIARKQAGKLDGLKNPIGYLVSISGKVAPPAADQVVQMSVEPSSGISLPVSVEPPRLSHADMIRIDEMWDAMTDKTAYETKAATKDQSMKRYPVPLHLLARSIFISEFTKGITI
jgi:phage replication O-like protein O